MTKRHQPSVEYLHECLEYTPASGELIWRVRPVSHFSSERQMLSVNSRMAGKPAGGIKKPSGRHFVYINAKSFHTPHIIFKMVNGYEAQYQVINRNGDQSDLRYDNLFEFAAGASYVSRLKHWRVKIYRNKKLISLGNFDSEMDATNAIREYDKNEL